MPYLGGDVGLCVSQPNGVLFGKFYSRSVTSTPTELKALKENCLDALFLLLSLVCLNLSRFCHSIFAADIVGFTAWSSVRDPTQVFTLLETLYNSFDSIAKRRGVFKVRRKTSTNSWYRSMIRTHNALGTCFTSKVETIGDCYVAATGLPEPRDDHAVVMGKFARDCMHKMLDLVHHLEVVLGYVMSCCLP